MNKIQFAKPEDVAQIVALGCSSFKENMLEEFGVYKSIDKALNVVLDSINEHVVLVQRNAENPKNIDGVLVIRTGEIWWSDKPLLSIALFFIKPEHRSFSLAKDFIKEAKEYAIINKTPLIFDITGQKDVEKKLKLMQYFGFKKCGSTYIFTGDE